MVVKYSLKVFAILLGSGSSCSLSLMICKLLFTIPDDLWGGCCITLTEVSKMCQQLPGIVGSSIALW